MIGLSESAASRSSAGRVAFGQSESGSGVQGAPGRRRRLLIVEDNYLVALSCEFALDTAGYDVLGVVARGEDALEQALAERPDLVLMDIRLAGTMNGIETALALREHGIRSLFASANTDAETIARSQAAQPLGWLRKPFSDGALVMAVENAFAKLQSETARDA